MKKISIYFALLFAAQMMWAASVTPADQIPTYWASANGKSGATLWSAVSTATCKNFKSIGYKNLYSAYLKTDVYPAGHAKAGKIWDMYGECAFEPSNTCGNYSGVCDCYNREHSIPQSWWGGGTGDIGNDIFHVLPTDGKVNGVRSNYEYGVVNGGTNWVGNKFGSAGSWSTDKKTIASSAGEVINGSGSVFEPKPEYKGDIARGLMGTIIKWQSDVTSGNNFFNGSYTASQNFGLTKKAVVLLMKWHREDPVSQKEIDRNNGIQQTQGNRNPFIDYPYLAEYIWGEHAGETVDMSKLMASTDPDFVPGKSDGWRGGDTPTPATKKYGVSWSVNGTVLKVDSIAENGKISTLPSAPTSCSTESNIFMGWTDAPIVGSQDNAPAHLYAAAAEFPAVTANIIFYAVFAHSESTSGGSVASTETFDFANMGLSNEQAITEPFVQNGVTVSFSSGSKYYNSGTAIRVYGGGSMTVAASDITQIDLTFGTSDKNNEITTNTGSYSDGQWTGSASQVIFTVGGTSGHRKIAKVVVTQNGSGEVTTYSRYITTCQDPQEVELVGAEDHARKVMVGGQIYIQLGEQLFTITGQRVK